MTSTVHIQLDVPFQRIDTLLNESLAGFKLNDSITMQKVQTSGKGELLYIVAEVTGAYDGKIAIRFKPRYDRAEREFHLDDVEFELVEPSLFAKGAAWLAKGFVTDKLDTNLEAALNAQFQQILTKHLGQQFDVNLPKGFALKTTIGDADITGLRAENGRLHCVISAQGSIAITTHDTLAEIS